MDVPVKVTAIVVCLLLLGGCATTQRSHAYQWVFVPDTASGQVGARSCMEKYSQEGARALECLRTISGVKQGWEEGLQQAATFSNFSNKTEATQLGCTIVREWTGVTFSSSQSQSGHVVLAMCDRTRLENAPREFSLRRSEVVPMPIHGRIGVGVTDVTEEVADAHHLEKPLGALLTLVEDGGPAHAAGLMQGDIILRAGGVAIDNARDLAKYIAGSTAGSQVNLLVWRQGSTHQRTVVVGEPKPAN